MPQPNAIVGYIDADTGELLATDRFYDSGLDPTSPYWRERIRAGKRFRPIMAYDCGMPWKGDKGDEGNDRPALPGGDDGGPPEVQEELKKIMAAFEAAAASMSEGSTQDDFDAELERLIGIKPERLSDEDFAELAKAGRLDPVTKH